MKIRPLQDRIVVKRIEEEDKTKGGIIIPDTAKEKPNEGRVIAVGHGRIEHGRIVPLEVKVGDRIIFGKYAGTEITVEHEEQVLLGGDEILGVLSSEGDDMEYLGVVEAPEDPVVE